MEVTPVIPQGRQLIQGYGAGYFTVGGVRHAGSVLIFPRATRPWSVTSPDALTADTLAMLREPPEPVEILILGMGGSFATLSAELRFAIKSLGMTPEAMATPAACRTYNILLAEERRVAAALIAMPAGTPQQ